MERQLERANHTVDFVFPSARDPEPMYSFKHALTQDVVYRGLLERRRRQYHAAVGAGLEEELYAGRMRRGGRAARPPLQGPERRGARKPSTTRLCSPGEKAQRRWANVEALAQFEGGPDASRVDAGHRGKPAAPDRRRDQAGQGEVRARPARRARGGARRHQGAGRHGGRRSSAPGRPGTTGPGSCRASWAGTPGEGDRLLPGDPGTSRTRSWASTKSGAFAECCLAHVLMAAGDLRETAIEGRRARPPRPSRRVGNIWWACRALWGAQSRSANYLGEWERGPATSGRARPRPWPVHRTICGLEGGRLVADGFHPYPTRRCGTRPSMLRGGAGSLSHRIRRRHGPRGARLRSSSRQAYVAAGITELVEAVALVRAVTSPLHPHDLRPLHGRQLPAPGRSPPRSPPRSNPGSR